MKHFTEVGRPPVEKKAGNCPHCNSEPDYLTWACGTMRTDSGIQQSKMCRIFELEAIASKLPTMQDGAHIYPDAEAWFPHPDGGVKFKRVGFDLIEECWCHGQSGRGVRFGWTDCYSAKAAAEAAKEK